MPFDRPANRTLRRTRMPARETLVLENARGTVIAVDHGCLWITLEGDTRDIVLTDGMRFEIDRHGRTIVVAEEDTRVRLSTPKSLRERLGDRLRRIWRSARQSRLVLLRRAVTEPGSDRRATAPPPWHARPSASTRSTRWSAGQPR